MEPVHCAATDHYHIYVCDDVAVPKPRTQQRMSKQEAYWLFHFIYVVKVCCGRCICISAAVNLPSLASLDFASIDIASAHLQ